MRNPRIVRWDLAQINYEVVPIDERKYYRGDLRNPREVVELKLRQLKFDQTEAGIRKRYEERLRGLLRGE